MRTINQYKAGAFLSYASFGLANLIGLLYTPYMLRMMGKEEYGLYSLVASIISYLTILDFGFGNAIVRYTAKYRTENRDEELPELYGMFTVFYCMMGLIAASLGIIIYYNVDTLFGKSMTIDELYKIRVMMGLMVINLFFTFAMSVWKVIPIAYECFVFSKGLNLARMLLNPIIMIVLLRMGYRAIALVFLITGLNITTLLIDYLYCKRKLHVTLRFKKQEKTFIKEVFIYSFWIFLGVIVERLYWSSGQFVLGINAGSSAVGLFAVAVQLAIFYTGISSAMPGILLPKLTKFTYSENGDQISADFFNRISRIQYLILFFVFIVFSIFGKNFIELWAGSSYSDVFFISWLFMLALLIPGAQAAGPIVAQARNEVKLYALIRLFFSVLGLVFSLFLSKHFGYYGCTIGITSALILQTIALNVYYKRCLKLDISQFWREIIRISWMPGIFCFICWFLLRNHQICSIGSLLLEIFVFVVILLSVFWFFSFNQSERDLVTIPIKKLLRITN